MLLCLAWDLYASVLLLTTHRAPVAASTQHVGASEARSMLAHQYFDVVT